MPAKSKADELAELRQAVAEIAAAQKQLAEAMAVFMKASQPPESKSAPRPAAADEEEALAQAGRRDVYHFGQEPVTVCWNGVFSFTLRPGLNRNVPEPIAQIYESSLREQEEARRRRELFASTRDVVKLDMLLHETKVPMR